MTETRNILITFLLGVVAIITVWGVGMLLFSYNNCCPKTYIGYIPLIIILSSMALNIFLIWKK